MQGFRAKFLLRTTIPWLDAGVLGEAETVEVRIADRHGESAEHLKDSNQATCRYYGRQCSNKKARWPTFAKACIPTFGMHHHRMQEWWWYSVQRRETPVMKLSPLLG